MTNCTSSLPISMKAMKRNAHGNRSVCKTLKKNIGNHARPALAPYTLPSAAMKTRHGCLCSRKLMLKRMVISMPFKEVSLGLSPFHHIICLTTKTMKRSHRGSYGWCDDGALYIWHSWYRQILERWNYESERRVPFWLCYWQLWQLARNKRHYGTNGHQT